MQKKPHYYVDSPLYKLEYTARLCSRHFSLFFKENFSHLDITEGECAVMNTIKRSPEISQIDLARLLFKGRSHITQILNSLESKKFIKRIDTVKNGRKIRQTVLTPEGEKIYNQIDRVCEIKYAKMCEYFERREKEFVAMLSEIQEILTEGETVKFD